MWSWTIKKAEHRRIDGFELWYWRRLLRIPWTSRRSNQSILNPKVLNIHWKNWWWSWNSNNLHLMWRTDSLEKTLMLVKIEGGRRRGWQRITWLNGINGLMDVNLNKFWEMLGDGQGSPACCSPWGCKESDTTEWLNWTELNWVIRD